MCIHVNFNKGLSNTEGNKVMRVSKRFGGMQDLAFFRGDIRDLS